MNQHVNTIANRLSLRPPQRDSLEILSRLCEIVPLEKGNDPAKALEIIKSEFSSVTDFERDFPSLCFALATGVGKTRLMGAFIAYLYKAENVRHFFVLAPNLTIYNKLIADFTPNTPKYVFQGISEFALSPPEIITGDNYESGRGVREETRKQLTTPGFMPDDVVHINIFNISKINSEVRGGRAPRIKRLGEYIGESYFEYLSNLDDLVLLMDESHRYRASAGIRAINELKPIIGLELTATPQIESGKTTEPFKNIIYSYPLSSAMNDGFVKEPAVATRENFKADNYDPAGLEQLKLEDAVRIHENSKVELEIYARDNQRPIVKPFMLVVAQDTTHADTLLKTIEDNSFFEGRYKGKVITVHSNIRGEDKDETIEQLISVEDKANPTEIVIHVNMLKEGWDVTNLYTIVPLRAANSRTLVEQSIGRGLRLPYGKRTGVPAVDRLTIVSHDRFQDIIDHANDPNSIIRTGVIIGRDIPDGKTKAVVVEPEAVNQIIGTAGGDTTGTQVRQPSLFSNEKEKEIAKATLEVIQEYERLPRSSELSKPEIQKEIVEKVKGVITPSQTELEGVGVKVDIAEVVAKTIDKRNELSIDIPRIVVVPTGEVTSGYRDFEMDVSNIRLQPVENEILVQHLHDNSRYRLISGDGIMPEQRLEDYLVRGLIDFNDISYDDHADLLYNLAGQVVRHLSTYLKNEDEIKNVLQYHQQTLVNLIHAQMQDHYKEEATTHEAKVSKGFTTLRPNNYSASIDENERDFRTQVANRQNIKGMLFGGFSKCLYRVQKFDSDSERRFAVILEDDKEVLKWFKPAKNDFRIWYRHDSAYEPDFVVETKTAKYICEPKQANEMTDETVLAKADAAAKWCQHATNHERTHGGKPWNYLLIPHDQIEHNRTFQGMVGSFLYRLRNSE